jgi:hypothetical protein
VAKNETDNNIARVVAEMSATATARTDRDWKAAEKAAQRERIDEEAEVAKRSAIEVLNERDRRDEAWLRTHLGSLTPHQYRTYIRERYGYDPGV